MDKISSPAWVALFEKRFHGVQSNEPGQSHCHSRGRD